MFAKSQPKGTDFAESDEFSYMIKNTASTKNDPSTLASYTGDVTIKLKDSRPKS